jgi:predicted nucleotidyltransferase
MSDQKFTILIGSRARGKGDCYSDVDIVRIGHKRAVRKKGLGRLWNLEGPISYVDYDTTTFASLYESGSLFIHHILTEGKLLAGDPVRWADLVRRFSVTKDLQSDISKQLRLVKWLARPEAFRQATMPLLSHLFKALKNAAIFSLAQDGVYIYDKREALRRAFPFLTGKDIDLLVEGNNAYIRGAPLFTSSRTLNAADALRNLCAKVNTEAGRLLRNGNQTDS